MKGNNIKILLLDIETAPNIAYVWGLWEQNVNLQMLQAPGYVLCWSAQWLGDKKVMFDSVSRSGKKKMLEGIHKLMTEADAIVTYNGARFDIPHLNGQFVLAGMTPPAPSRQIDLLAVVKSRFKFPSNKLEFVAKELGIGSKLKHQGFDLWLGCLRNEPQAWATMERYNKQDTALLGGLYHKLLPWIKNHPCPRPTRKGDHCTNCGSHEVHYRGVAIVAGGERTRFQCQKCGRWMTSKVLHKTDNRMRGDNL